jgi:hypothetical protein
VGHIGVLRILENLRNGNTFVEKRSQSVLIGARRRVAPKRLEPDGILSPVGVEEARRHVDELRKLRRKERTGSARRTGSRGRVSGCGGNNRGIFPFEDEKTVPPRNSVKYHCSSINIIYDGDYLMAAFRRINRAAVRWVGGPWRSPVCVAPVPSVPSTASSCSETPLAWRGCGGRGRNTGATFKYRVSGPPRLSYEASIERLYRPRQHIPVTGITLQWPFQPPARTEARRALPPVRHSRRL